MNQLELIIEIFKKYKFHQPVAVNEQKMIFKSRKKVLYNIIRKEKIDSIFVLPTVNLYYYLKKFSNTITLAGSSRALNAALASIIIIIGVGTFFPVKYYYNKSMYAAAELALARGTITHIIGDVKILRPGEEPRQLRLKDVVQKGDSIKTGQKSLAMLQTATNLMIRIQQNSSVAVNSLLESGNAVIDIEQGLVLSKIKKLKKGWNYNINTHNAVAAVRGTQFSVNYESEKTKVEVTEGIVDVQLLNPKYKNVIDKTTLQAGMSATLSNKIEIQKTDASDIPGMEALFKAKYIEDIEKSTIEELEKYSKEQDQIEKELSKKQTEADNYPTTLEGLKAKYNRLDEISLFSGKVHKGVILSRGNVVMVLTPDGVIKIPAKTIKNTRVIK